MLPPSPIPPTATGNGTAKSPLTRSSVHSRSLRSLAPLLNDLPSATEPGPTSKAQAQLQLQAHTQNQILNQNQNQNQSHSHQSHPFPLPLPQSQSLSTNLYPPPHSHPVNPANSLCHSQKSNPLSHLSPIPIPIPIPNPNPDSNSNPIPTQNSNSTSISNSNPNFKHPSPIDSNPTFSPSPPTPSALPPRAGSPSSYHAYRPEWTSVSSPILASPFDNHSNNLHPPPPRKKTRQVLVGLHSSPHIPFDRHHHHHHHHHDYRLSHHDLPNALDRSASANHLKPPGSPHQLQPIRTHNVPSSTSSHENDDVLPHNHHRHHLDSRLHLFSLPRSMILDEDRGLSSRPLKNTKRAAQNRAAQRAFRERKDRHVRELETRSAQFEEFMLRHASLDERERSLEVREAGVMYFELNKPGASGREPESKRAKRDGYVDRLQQEVNNLQRELVRLRGELSTANGSERRQGGRETIEPVSAARLEGGRRRLSSSSGSSAMGGSETFAEHGAQLGERSADQNHSSGRASGLAEGVEAHERDENRGRRSSEPKPPLTIMIDERAKLTQRARNTWPDGISSPDSAMYQPYSAPAQAEHHYHHRPNGSTGHSPPMVRRALTLGCPQRLIRLPPIQKRSDDYWWKEEERRSRTKNEA